MEDIVVPEHIQPIFERCMDDIQRYQLNFEDVNYLTKALMAAVKQKMTIAPTVDKNDCQKN